MNKILLIDGSSMITTDYYGSAPFKSKNESDEDYFKKILHTSNGVYTNAITVMLKTLLTLIKEWHPDKIGLAFDQNRATTFRRKIYPNYKGTRKPTPLPLSQQKNEMLKILNELKIPVLQSEEYEADDIIYTWAKYYDDGNNKIDIITKDRDYWQIASDNITIWMPQSSKAKAMAIRAAYNINNPSLNTAPTCISKMVPYTADEILIESGVTPSLIPQWKGIAGDTSDNIPGVKGVKAAAAPLLMYYGGLDDIYEAIQNPKEFEAVCKDLNIRPNPLKHLVADKTNAYLSTKLATMSNVPSLTVYPAQAHIEESTLLNIIKEYEINSLIPYVENL